MSDCQREMTLEEWVYSLPEIHKARKQYEELKALTTPATVPSEPGRLIVHKFSLPDGKLVEIADERIWIYGPFDYLGPDEIDVIHAEIHRNDPDLAKLGEKMGFDPMTVQPILGKCERFFSAVPVEGEDEQDIESTRSDVVDALVKAAEKVVLAIDEAQIVWILDAGKKLKDALAAYRGEVNGKDTD